RSRSPTRARASATRARLFVARLERLVSNMAASISRAKGRSAARLRRHARLRKKIVGTEARPRLVVTRSSRHVFVQVIDDAKGHTVASAPTMEADLRRFEGDKTDKAHKVGELGAERAKSAGIEAVVFDRGGSKYAGRVAAVADGAREGGLSL